MNQIFKLLIFLSVFLNCFSAIAQEESKSLHDVLAQLDTEQENDDESLLKKVKLYEEKENYVNSRVIMAKELSSNFSHKIVSYWIQSDQKLLDSLIVKNERISTFEPTKISWSERFHSIHDPLVYLSNNSPTTPPVAPPPPRAWKDYPSERMKEERLKKDENKNFGELAKNDITATLKKFDNLKMSVSTLQTVIDHRIQQDYKQIDQDELDKLNEYKKQAEKMKIEIKNKRTRFLSYDAVSPYLAVASQYLYLAKAKASWFQRNKEVFDTAIKNLSLACHHQMLMECSKDVREQFFEVQKELKAMVSEKEFEELKVITTLQDSNDTSKKRGADAWWE